MICRTVLPGLTMLAFLLGPASVIAAEDSEARAQYKRGLELYQEDKFEEAAIAFSRAYELKPSYKILYNLGQAENESGNYTRALDAYQLYLSEGGATVPAKRKKAVRADVERLKSLVGAITIICPVDGAAVMIDGIKKGQTPMEEPMMVDIGQREVVVKRSGERIHREVLRVAGGQKVVIKVEVAGYESAAPPGPAPHLEPGSTQPAPVADSPGQQRAPETRRRLWTWVALGIGGAAAVGAGVTGGLALSLKKDIQEDCYENHCLTSRSEDLDKARTLANTSTVLTAVAGAGIVAGVVLFFVEPRFDSGQEVVVMATPAVGPGSAALSLTGSF